MILVSASRYLSLVKFSHTLFALPFAIIGYVGAISFSGAAFEPLLLIKVLLCMVFARSAAMAFNRWADRDIDAKNERTAVREIPSGLITSNAALVFAVVNAFAFITTTFFINAICFYLSPVALLVVMGYSYTKRFTPFSHIVLGIGLSLAPVGAWLAVTGSFHLIPVLFSLVVLTWVSGFDIIYALQDESFDREQKLYSIPSVFGKTAALKISVLLHMFTSLFLLSIYFISGYGPVYLAGWFLFSGLLVYQHTIVKPNDLSKVNMAFFTTNGIASVVFALFFVADRCFY